MPTCPYCAKNLEQAVLDRESFCPYCGNRLPKAGDRSGFIGRKIGDHYIITDKLGEGGMGYVFKARHTMLDKEVAIKVLREDFADNPDAFERFRREAKNTSRLNHPNAVAMYDFGQTDDNLVYIILEYINGGDLKTILGNDGPFPESRAAPIFVQMCDVLEEAHEQGIIHRDLKSENIMLCERAKRRDFVKVLDFGIAKLMNVGGRTTGGTLTQKGVVFGTPQYMCPEQVQGLKMDQRSDIYSLGVIMYEVLTGDVPFNAGNPVDIMVMQVKEKPESFRKFHKINVSSTLEKIVMKCLEKKPQARFQSVRELKEALTMLVGAAKLPHFSSDPQTVSEDRAKARKDAISASTHAKNKKAPVGFKLINIEGLDSNETAIFKATPVRIGRHSSNDIVVKQPRVSKMHAEIHFKDKQYILIDKASLNGSYVNGRNIKAEVIENDDLLEFSKSQGLKVRFKVICE
jgi:serine/threonine-protein kinase